MATPLNLGLLDNFSVIFIILLLFAILYGLLELVKIFGEGKHNLNAIISLMITIIAAMSPDLVKMLKLMLPWIAMMIVFFFFLFAIPMFMGMTKTDITTFMGGKKRIGTVGWVFGAMIFLIIYSMGNMFGEKLLVGDVSDSNSSVSVNASSSSGFQSNVFKTVFNPKIIGLFFILLLSMLAITYLTKD